MKVNIDGNSYTVKESLGFQGGYNAKIIDYKGEEMVAIYQDKRWRLWTTEDRLQKGSRYFGQ